VIVILLVRRIVQENRDNGQVMHGWKKEPTAIRSMKKEEVRRGWKKEPTAIRV